MIRLLRHPAARFHCQFHITEEIIEAAQAAGFGLEVHEDVTEGAIPSLDWSIAALEKHRDPMINYFIESCPDIEHQYHTCRDFGVAERDWYKDGRLGYELFRFRLED